MVDVITPDMIAKAIKRFSGKQNSLMITEIRGFFVLLRATLAHPRRGAK